MGTRLKAVGSQSFDWETEWELARQETLDAVLKIVQEALPIRPRPVFESALTTIPGIATGAAYSGSVAAPDAVGSLGSLIVPVSGILQSATYYDKDDEGTQLDIVLFSAAFTVQNDNDAFTIADADLPNKIYELKFTVFNDNVNNQDSSIENIGKAYTVTPLAPGSKLGTMYFQAKTSTAPNIAAGSVPVFKLQILPDF